MTGYAPVSRIADDAGTATTLSVEPDTGDRFPAAPFTALVWPGNAIPEYGVNAEQPTVVAIDLDTFTIVRGDPSIDIPSGYHIAALSTVPLYDIGDIFVDADVLYARTPQGETLDVEGGTVVLDVPGLWFLRDEDGIEHDLFVRYSEVI